jgi:hypothetical protein
MIDLPRARLALLAAVLLPASASATPAGDTPHGGGALLDVAVEHYLPRWPLRLSLELSPLALSMPLPGRDAGSALVGHLRLGAALATKYVEVGASAGSHLQENGASGFSLAGTLRLGTLDGLRLDLGYGHVLARSSPGRAGARPRRGPRPGRWWGWGSSDGSEPSRGRARRPARLWRPQPVQVLAGPGDIQHPLGLSPGE